MRSGWVSCVAQTHWPGLGVRGGGQGRDGTREMGSTAGTRVCVRESGAGGQGLRTDVWFRNGKARAAKPGPSVEYSSCTPGAALRDPAQQCPAFDAIKVAVEHGHYGFAGVRGPTPTKIHVYLWVRRAKPEPTVSTGWPRRKKGEGGRRDGRRGARRSVRWGALTTERPRPSWQRWRQARRRWRWWRPWRRGAGRLHTSP